MRLWDGFPFAPGHLPWPARGIVNLTVTLLVWAIIGFVGWGILALTNNDTCAAYEPIAGNTADICVEWAPP